MTTSCTDTDHPYYEELLKFDGESHAFFLDKPSKFKFVSLGEALDFASFGGMNYVAYRMNTKKLTHFIRNWMKSQRPKIDYERIPDSKIEGVYTIKEKKKTYNYRWNNFEKDGDVELPRTKYNVCPRNEEHKKLVRDLGGRIRCAHQTKKEIKPSFTDDYLDIDSFSGLIKKDYIEMPPEEPGGYIDDDKDNLGSSEEWEEYYAEKEKFDAEKAEEVSDICYAIIEEPKNMHLPLEIILDRLNCYSHIDMSVHPFSGFTLANYVKAWHNQNGKKKVWKHKGETNSYKEFSYFQPISSED